MTNREVDLASINRDILLNPSASAKSALVRLLELEDPELKFLCPLAKAIYLIETGRQSHASNTEALETLWCVDDSFASDTSYTGSHAQVNENVLHSIAIQLEKKSILLGFSSSTTMTHYSGFWSEYVRSIPGGDWCSCASMSTDEFVESIFSQLDQEARGQSPQGYPTDSGSFIGSSSYTLVSIGEQPVDGPTFKDSYHEQNWDGLSEEYPQQFEEENCEAPGGFYWLHYLNKKQAEKLGLLAPKNEAVGAHGDHPEWASRTFVENEDRSWVSTDMIFDSYSDGQLQVEPSKYAYIAIGCGKSWDPSSDPKENEEIDQDTGITEYPESSAPLLKIEIIRGSHDYPEELSRLLPYLKRFND